jgi:hypothetical protein
VPDLRASDADRERSVAALRHHAAAGRLTLEELDERSERAYAAKTLAELAKLQADLPAVATRPTPAPERPRRLPSLPGRFAFTSRWHSPAGAKATMAELIAHVSGPLQNFGYELIQREDDRLRFEREVRPAWTFLGLLLPPFGLIALLHKDRERITIDLAEDEHGTHLVASGTAPLAVRRAFAELED